MTVVSTTHMRLKAKDLDLNDLPLHNEALPKLIASRDLLHPSAAGALGHDGGAVILSSAFPMNK
jgi:hypothetical protein